MSSSLASGRDSLPSLVADAPASRQRRARWLARRGWAASWPKLLAIALVLGVWELVHLSGWKKLVLPGPWPAIANLWGQLHTSLLWRAVGTTSERAVVGFAVAVLIGSAVGALVSRIAPLRAAVGSLITGLQILPSVAWVPFAIVLFGLNTSAIMFVIVMGAAPSVANGLIAGVDYTPPLLLRAGKVMGLRRLHLWRYLIVPASLPAYVAGLRQGWAFAFRSLMAGELLVTFANTPSLGVLLSTDQDQSDLTSAISVIIVILFLGIVVHTLFGLADTSIRRRWGLAPAS